MANKATVNASADQKFVRDIGRVKTLKLAIEKATARGDSERVNALQVELDRRMASINAIRAELDTL